MLSVTSSLTLDCMQKFVVYQTVTLHSLAINDQFDGRLGFLYYLAFLSSLVDIITEMIKIRHIYGIVCPSWSDDGFRIMDFASWISHFATAVESAFLTMLRCNHLHNFLCSAPRLPVHPLVYIMDGLDSPNRLLLENETRWATSYPSLSGFF